MEKVSDRSLGIMGTAGIICLLIGVALTGISAYISIYAGIHYYMTKDVGSALIYAGLGFILAGCLIETIATEDTAVGTCPQVSLLCYLIHCIAKHLLE